ncbi:MAG: four helix bundle protein [Alphaproteobacteria bacterium]
MALAENLRIYKECYKLLIEVYRITNKFTKEHKYGLGQEIREKTFNLFLYIYKANVSEEKTADLEKFLENYYEIKLRIRLCKDMNIMSIKSLVVISVLLESIGKQATAWKSSIKKVII